MCMSVVFKCVHVQLEMDLQKVKVERLRSSKAVGDYMEAFERKRTQDLKVCLEKLVSHSTGCR